MNEIEEVWELVSPIIEPILPIVGLAVFAFGAKLLVKAGVKLDNSYQQSKIDTRPMVKYPEPPPRPKRKRFETPAKMRQYR